MSGNARLHLIRTSVFLLLVLLAGCRDGPFGPPGDPDVALLQVSADVTGTAVHALVVEVTAEDIATPLTFDLEVENGAATGTLRVPVGSARTFTGRGFDARGEITHQGSTTLDISAGTNPPLQLVLLPINGDVSIIVIIGTVTVSIDPAEARIAVGETLQLNATIRDGEGQVVEERVHWATTDAALATVDREGLVTARSAGTVQIVAAYAGVATTARITIVPADEILFAASLDGSTGIFLVNADGSNRTRLTSEPGGAYAPTWSPDGSTIAFVSSRAGPMRPEIYIMEADGSGQRQLTYDMAWPGYPVWSPDGSRIAYVSARNQTDLEIYVISIDGTGDTRLTNDLGSDNYPAWSPDGSRIAFVSNRDGSSDIYVMNADGSDQTRLSFLGGSSWPEWSPDGSQIAFQANLSEQPGSGIHVMAADGSDIREVGRLSNGGPQWSPDGSVITFVGYRDGNYEIFSVRPDGSDLQNLTANAAHDVSPTWSPHSDRIAFVSDRDGSDQIYIMDATGLDQRRLTRDLTSIAFPTWRPRRQ